MDPPEAVITFTIVASASTALLMLVRAVAKRIAGGGVGVSQRQLEELRDEVAFLKREMDAMHGRVGDLDEIQNRLDFAERLLAKVKERPMLQEPSH